ncbi:Hypp5996 [Branchiostoma lanceolatum]|uniref:Hypp5996 protein n=1 Tax=Branchiostoma lanceolatum TaxID=7740 RepID=A0A8J9YS73_BRALA|nr:Hypp5996 [Branchiostoma lanceolatum]
MSQNTAAQSSRNATRNALTSENLLTCPSYHFGTLRRWSAVSPSLLGGKRSARRWPPSLSTVLDDTVPTCDMCTARGRSSGAPRADVTPGQAEDSPLEQNTLSSSLPRAASVNLPRSQPDIRAIRHSPAAQRDLPAN